jgi:hypothetical protein
MAAPLLVAVALLWPALLPWLVATVLPVVLAWWTVRHARRVAWGAIDLVERAARAARITRTGLPLLLTVVRTLLVATTAVAATRPFLGDGAAPYGTRIIAGDAIRRIELVTAASGEAGSSLAMRSALEALARTRPGAFPAVDLVSMDDAGRAADPARLIILCDGMVPDADDAARLATVVRRGTAVLVCLGPDSVGSPRGPRSSAWLETLAGVSLAGCVPLEDEAIRMMAPDGAAPLQTAAELAGPRVSCVAEIVLSEGDQLEPRVVARSATTGRPLLVESTVGRGRVAVSALPLALPASGASQAPWSDLAAWPVFVPFVDRLVTELLEPTEQMADSTSRTMGRFAGLALARPLLACSVLLAVLEAVLTWRRGRTDGRAFDAASLGGRCLVVTALGGMVALWGGHPTDRPTRSRDASPVAVMIDVSPSMGSMDLPTASRLGQLIEAASGGDTGTSVFNRLTSDRPVVIHAAAEEMRVLGRYPDDVTRADLRRLIPALPAADASRLGDAVLAMLEKPESDRPAAVVVMSDGALTGGASWEAVADSAARRGVPLVAVPSGNDAIPSADLPTGFRFTAAAAPAICQPGETVTIRVRGVASTKRFRPLMLRAEGGEASLVADPSPRASGYDYDCAAGVSLPIPAAVPTESTHPRGPALPATTRTLTLAVGDDNDRHVATLPIVVADEPIRVLLVDHGPSYEVRFLARLLADDSRYAVTTRLLAARDIEALRAEATLPQSAEAWDAFDVVVLGDLPIETAEADAAAWEALHEAVIREGVGVAWLPGRRWAEADAGMVGWLPAVPEAVFMDSTAASLPRRVRLLPAGRATGWLSFADAAGDSTRTLFPRTFSTLPPVTMPPLARVIAVSETDAGDDLQPAIVVSQLGQGMVVGHLCETWRWQGGGEVPTRTAHARYWLHLLPRLAERRRLARLVAATVAVRPLDPLVGESVHVDVMPTRPTADLAGWTLEVESADQSPRRLGIVGALPGAVATLRLEGLAAGRHRLRLVPPAQTVAPPMTVTEREIVVNERHVEAAGGPAGTGPLQAAIEAGGGAVVPLDRIEMLPDTIAAMFGGRRERGDRSPHWLKSQSAAHLFLVAFVAACAVAWWPRRNSTLVEMVR